MKSTNNKKVLKNTVGLVLDDVKDAYDDFISKMYSKKAVKEDKMRKNLSKLEEKLDLDFKNPSLEKYITRMSLAAITGTMKAAVIGGFGPKTRMFLEDKLFGKYEKATLYVGDVSKDDDFYYPYKAGDHLYASDLVNSKFRWAIHSVIPLVIGRAYDLTHPDTYMYQGGGLVVGLAAFTASMLYCAMDEHLRKEDLEFLPFECHGETNIHTKDTNYSPRKATMECRLMYGPYQLLRTMIKGVSSATTSTVNYFNEKLKQAQS